MNNSRVVALALVVAAGLVSGCSSPGQQSVATTEQVAPSPSVSVELQRELAAAVGANDATRVAQLLEQGADPNANVGRVGTTFAVDIAVELGSVDVIAMLAEAGANLDAVSSGNPDTPVARAANIGNPELVSALVLAGADPALLPGPTSWGPTHYGGYAGDVAVLAALLDAGVDPDIPDNDGYTALHFAAATGSLEAVRLLVEAGADPKAVAGNGFTPADSAADRNQAETLAYLEGLA